MDNKNFVVLMFANCFSLAKNTKINTSRKSPTIRYTVYILATTYNSTKKIYQFIGSLPCYCQNLQHQIRMPLGNKQAVIVPIKLCATVTMILSQTSSVVILLTNVACKCSMVYFKWLVVPINNHLHAQKL